jgi:organic hydroperoxide reductase OsmC/OhrA
MSKIHTFSISLSWKDQNGLGTTDYNAYSRNHTISSTGKVAIPGSSDPVFRGDGSKYNPEELMIAAASGCHMLWYLHLCADSGVVVTDYKDAASGNLIMESDGSGHFEEIMLNPVVEVTQGSMVEKAMELHDKAHQMCFIANSCNFPIKHTPHIIVSAGH